MPEPANLGMPIESQSWYHYAPFWDISFNQGQLTRDLEAAEKNARKCINGIRIERMMLGRLTAQQQMHAPHGRRCPLEIMFLQSAVASMGAYLMAQAVDPKIAVSTTRADPILLDLQKRVSGWFDRTRSSVR